MSSQSGSANKSRTSPTRQQQAPHSHEQAQHNGSSPPSPLNNSKSSLADKMRKTLDLLRRYAGDWVLTIVLAGVLWSVNRARGFRSQFSLEDKSIQYTHIEDERVPTSLLAVTCLVAPVIIQGIVCLGIRRLDWFDFHQSCLGLLLTHGITLTVTTAVKVTVGRCRPDFIDRCQPPPGATDPVPYGLNTEAICTTDINTSIIRDGFRSFPSGHSSAAFAGLTFLTLFLAGHFHLFGDRARVWVAWLVATPPLGATLIAITRLMDNRHHPGDVIAGSLLGAVVALGVYHQYYPPLFHPDSQRPYKPALPAKNLIKSAAQQEDARLLNHGTDQDIDLESAMGGPDETTHGRQLRNSAL